MYDDLPERAISIMQPWSALIVNGLKDIENRNWGTKFRGTVAIHAGKKIDKDANWDICEGFHPVSGEQIYRGQWDTITYRPTGGIVGVADIVDCVDHSDSDWFVGKYGFVLANQRPVPFIPCKGALGFFKWKDRIINE